MTCWSVHVKAFVATVSVAMPSLTNAVCTARRIDLMERGARQSSADQCETQRNAVVAAAGGFVDRRIDPLTAGVAATAIGDPAAAAVQYRPGTSPGNNGDNPANRRSMLAVPTRSTSSAVWLQLLALVLSRVLTTLPILAN